jgi:hypothetical protein
MIAGLQFSDETGRIIGGRHKKESKILTIHLAEIGHAN